MGFKHLPSQFLTAIINDICLEGYHASNYWLKMNDGGQDFNDFKT
jgi:hypothetical protein